MQGTMDKETIIVSMTTWPPRSEAAVKAMQSITNQEHSMPVHFVLVLSKDEWENNFQLYRMMEAMIEDMDVEVIWDYGNIRSHKKLIPTLQRYPDNAILVVDDDMTQQNGWLEQFIQDHQQHPNDIIYGHAGSRVIIRNGRIEEGISQRGIYTYPGRVTYNEKPANGSAGTLYPSGTFTDPRFFDRETFMRLTPTSDETWQWAWAVMAECTFRCLSSHNQPTPIKGASNPLFHTNIGKYTQYHNAIASEFPEYKEKLQERISQNPIHYKPKYNEL